MNALDRHLRWLAVAVTLAALPIAAAPAPASAQETGRIQGSVVDVETSQPLAGVQVFIPGTQHGTLTNAQGRYLLLNVPPGSHSVRANIIGYASEARTVELAAGGSATANFELGASAIELDELVVTGQGREIRRREIGTAVASINTAELETAPVQSMSEMLQGRAPGVNILSGGGKVGQGMKVVLRGPGSFSQNIEPVIYVDGVRIDDSKAIGVWTGGTGWSGLDDINPADVERVEIVKGPAAATLYGTEASAGVIQIFTRRGREGGNDWSYRGEYGLSNTPSDWWDVSVYSDWFYDNYVRTAPLQEHQLSTSGGQEGFTYYASGTYRTADGVLPNNGEDYGAFRANLQLFPRNDLVVRFHTGYSSRTVDMPQDANNIYGYGINALTGGAQGNFMAVDQIELIAVQLESGRFTGGATAEYTPTENFSNRLTVGLDMLNTDNTDFHPYGGNSFNPRGRKEVYRRDAQSLTFDYAGSFSASPAEFMSSSTTLGFQAYREQVGIAEAYGWDFPSPGLSTVAAAANTTGWEYRLTTKSAGAFLQQRVGLWDRLFLTAGVRADGHSAFGEDYPYQIYPSANLSWVASEHGFVPDVFSSLRFRAGYGTAGQQPGAFDAVRTWEPTAAFEGEPAVTPQNVGNAELAPEVSHEFEAGVDMSLLRDRFGLEATYFHQRTGDALLPVQYPPSDGFLSTQLENVGAIRNHGVELGASAVLMESEDLSWDVGANVSFTENEVLDLGDLPELYVQWTQATREGYPIGGFYGSRYIVDENGDVVEVHDEPWRTDESGAIVLGEDGNPVTNPDNPGYIGPAFPTRTVQLSTSARLWDRLQVRAMVDHAGGHYTESATVRWLTRLTVPDDDPVLPDMAGEPVAMYCHTTDDPALQAFCDDPWPSGGRGNVVMPADYWKLREVSVTYDLPGDLLGRTGIGLRNASVYLSGRNLWRSLKTLSLEAEADYDTTDELSNQEYFVTPIPRQFVLGIRVGF